MSETSGSPVPGGHGAAQKAAMHLKQLAEKLGAQPRLPPLPSRCKPDAARLTPPPVADRSAPAA
jgi:hypothetical protein